MKLNFTKNFKKHYTKRIKPHSALDKKFKQRIKRFSKNPHHPLLKNHILKGAKKDIYSIAITGDIRALYYYYKKEFYFIDIGTHAQVY